MIEVNPYLDQLAKDTEQIIAFIRTEVMDLDENQLYYKPGSKKWSILECIEHMNIATRHYVDIMKIKIPKALSKQQQPVRYYKRGFLGRLCINAMAPTKDGQIKSRVKTLSRFKPVLAFEKGKSGVIEEFISLNETLLDQLLKARHLNVNKVRIKSGIGSIIRFKLADAMGFVVGHNQRHIIQIKRILHTMPQKAETHI